MKLGIVASEFPPAPGGMQQHALGLSNTLAMYYDIGVFTSEHHANHPYNLSYSVYPILKFDRTDISKICAYDMDMFLVLNAGYAILSNFTKKPVICYCHGNDFLNPWIHTADPNLYSALVLMKRIPFFWRFARTIWLQLNRRQVSRGFSNLIEIFVNSSYTGERVAREYPNIQCPITISHPGLPIHFFSKMTERRFNCTNWRFLTVARLAQGARKKNVDGILRALASLSNCVNFEYTIIGDGDLRGSLELLANELGIADRVCFFGNASNQTVLEYLDNTDLFLLPSKASLNDVESFGIVYLEAAARGVPSIASKEGGAIDAIQNMKSGIIIDKSDPQSIAAAVQVFVKNPARFDPEKVRAWAERFHWEKTSRVIRNSIDGIMCHRAITSRG